MAGEIILYNTEDGSAVIQLRARNGSVWLTQAEMAELFQTSVSNINKHIKGIIAEGEQPPATIELYSIVQTEGRRTVTDTERLENLFEPYSKMAAAGSLKSAPKSRRGGSA